MAYDELNELSSVADNNGPAGSDVIGATLDNQLRGIKANIARSAREESTATASAAATLAVTVLNKIVPVSGSAGGSTTITLPAAATAGAGFRFTAWKTDSTNNVIIQPDGAETVNGAANYTLATQYEAAQFVTDGTSWVVESTAKRELGSADIADGSITTAKLAASAVTADKLGSDSVTAAKIQASAVGESELASNSVSTAKIQSSAVGESQLATNSVSAGKIQASAVGESELASASVSSAKIQSSAVSESHLASDSVSSAKIQANAVGSSEISSGAVGTSELASASVSSAKIQTGAVGESQLASASVSSAKIQSSAVGESQLASDSVSSAKIQANAVGASEIASGAVGTSELSNDSATNAKLANMAQDTIKGRATAGTGDPEDLTASQVRTMLSVYDQSTSDSRYVNVSGDTMTGNLSFGDNDKAIFGTDSDLEIYHSGTASIIRDSGVGNLSIQAEDFAVQSSDGSATHIFVDTSTGYTSLGYGGSAKLATTSSGIDVTGTVTSDGATIDGDATVTGRLGDSDGDYGSAGQVLSSTGTGTNWVAAGAYTLPEATSTTRGGIELFSDTDQSVAANAVSSTAGKTYGIQLNSSGQAVVNVPWTDTSYTLPEATSTTRGGIELFSDTDQSVAANAVSSTAGRTYGVQLNSSGQAVVNVPWTDTNTGGTVTGTGTNNRVAVWSGTSSQDSSSTFTWDGSTLAVDGAVTINDSGSNVDLRVESSGETHALFVDGQSGVVRMAAQPAFSGQSSSNTGSSVGSTLTTVKANNVNVNRGNHYNTSTGIFTCPEHGVYQVSFYTIAIASLPDGTFSTTRSALYKNGVAVYGTPYNFGDGYRPHSGEWHVECSANDTLQVKTNDSLGSYNGLNISFKG